MQMNRLDRISAILVRLQSRSVVRAADCAERFGVSVRTIYRDIRTLEQAGVPICGDAGVGYSLMEGYRLPPLMFTREEATAFLTAEKVVEQIADRDTGEQFHRGMDKIRAVMRGAGKEQLAGLDDSIHVHRSRHTPPETTPGLLQTILRSIADRVIIEMDYTNGADGSSRRLVEAVGVSFSHPRWYLTAWCHLRGEYRTFRLDRIASLTVTDCPHTIAAHPPQVSLLGHDDPNCLTRVVIRTTSETARRNRDASFFLGLVEQQELPDGRLEQTYMTYSVETMARWVLAHADTTEVVSPVEVTEWITKILCSFAPANLSPI